MLRKFDGSSIAGVNFSLDQMYVTNFVVVHRKNVSDFSKQISFVVVFLALIWNCQGICSKSSSQTGIRYVFPELQFSVEIIKFRSAIILKIKLKMCRIRRTSVPNQTSRVLAHLNGTLSPCSSSFQDKGITWRVYMVDLSKVYELT